LYVALIWFIGLAATSLALLVSCVVPTAKQAVEAAPLIFVPQIMFSGFFIRMELVPVWLRWIQHITPLKYAVNLATIAEFGWPSCDYVRRFPVIINATTTATKMETLNQCTTLLDANDVETSLWWLYLLILIVIFVVVRILAAFALAMRARNYG
tara:strand:+ start:139 stop:600 length:462 start_codon:yes stop_codon:yes gene_type:complete